MVKQSQFLYDADETGVIVSSYGGEKMANKKNYERRIVIDPKVHFLRSISESLVSQVPGSLLKTCLS
jgi:hypothetical protein